MSLVITESKGNVNIRKGEKLFISSKVTLKKLLNLFDNNILEVIFHVSYKFIIVRDIETINLVKLSKFVNAIKQKINFYWYFISKHDSNILKKQIDKFEMEELSESFSSLGIKQDMLKGKNKHVSNNLSLGNSCGKQKGVILKKTKNKNEKIKKPLSISSDNSIKTPTILENANASKKAIKKKLLNFFLNKIKFKPINKIPSFDELEYLYNELQNDENNISDDKKMWYFIYDFPLSKKENLINSLKLNIELQQQKQTEIENNIKNNEVEIFKTQKIIKDFEIEKNRLDDVIFEKTKTINTLKGEEENISCNIKMKKVEIFNLKQVFENHKKINEGLIKLEEATISSLSKKMKLPLLITPDDLTNFAYSTRMSTGDITQNKHLLDNNNWNIKCNKLLIEQINVFIDNYHQVNDIFSNNVINDLKVILSFTELWRFEFKN